MSTTLTVLVTGAAALPAESDTLYVMVYEPMELVSTVPLETTTKFSSRLSVAIAPASEYELPTSNDTVA